jgi:hypothetical protein
MLIVPTIASAQSVNKSYDTYNFVQAQGGLHMPFASGKIGSVIQPSWGVNLGRWFTPAFGARIGVEGLSSKVQVGDNYDKFNYLNFNLDGLFDLLPVFTNNNSGKNKIYLIGGLGLNVLTDKGARPAYNLRLGAGYAYQISKPLSLSLEYRVNNTADYFNGVENNSDDWFSSLFVGVAYNFGHKTHVIEAPALLTPVKELTLYDQMQAGVKERMDTWMKRLKGESKADYLLRTSDEAVKTQRLEYTKAIATDMAGNRANTNLKDLQYNTQAQLLGVEFTDMPAIVLSVPQSEIGSFKSVRDVQFANTIYELNPNDQFEVVYTDAINRVTDKKYNYIRPTDGKQVSSEGYMPIAAVHQAMENNVRLQKVAEKTVAAAKAQEILSENTTITVSTKPEIKENGTVDYHVDYSYTVKDDFSVKDDFAPGKYDAENSNASTAMLKIINETLNGDIAKYFAAGKAVQISYHGSADAKPINGTIAYNGKYGDIKDQAVTVNGKQEKMTVTKASGITTNEQLSLVRAISVRDYINKNVSKLKDMKVTESYSVDVSNDEGAKYRRVAVNFIFHDAQF